MRDPHKNRYLLCRPEGGLNDVLSEIGKCISYGRKFGRIVIVETNSKAASHFKDVFGQYFTSQSESLILDAAPFVAKFDAMEVQPQILKGFVSAYLPAVNEKLNRGQLISFDFSKDYDEELLVHHSAGQRKGRSALTALSQLSISQPIADELKRRLIALGEHYHAFHVRHTDHKTDYEGRVLKLAPVVKDKIFIGTDNKAVVAFFCDVFGPDRVTSFSELPDKLGKALHYNNVGDDIWRRNRDAIVDLLILVLADKYSFFSRLSGKRRYYSAYSGYSVLAARLRFSQHIVRRLLPEELHGRVKSPRLAETIGNLRWRYF